MTFDLFWIDFWLTDTLFGFGIFTFKKEDIIRSMFSIYWNDGELLIDLFWFRIFSNYPLFALGFDYDNELGWIRKVK